MTRVGARIVVLTLILALLPVAVSLAADLSTPKASIASQFELLKAGDVEGLKACFTDRLKDKITAESVKKGQGETAKYTLEDLVDKVEQGKGTAKIKMKNGRTLTTLIEKDGKWYADTIWFK